MATLIVCTSKKLNNVITKRQTIDEFFILLFNKESLYSSIKLMMNFQDVIVVISSLAVYT